MQGLGEDSNHAHNQAGLDHMKEVSVMLSLIHIFPVLIVTSLAGFCWGMIWYHPRLFGHLWETCQPHRKPEDFQTYHKPLSARLWLIAFSLA